MAEMLVAAGISSAAGTAAAGTAAGTATAAAAGSGWLGTALTAASAGFSLLSGMQQSAALRGQAKIADFNARQQHVQGLAEGNRVRETMLRTLAAQNAVYASRGFDLGSGTPVTMAEETTAAGRRQIDTAADNAAMQAGQQRMTAASLRSQATGAMLAGVSRAGFSLLDRIDL